MGPLLLLGKGGAILEVGVGMGVFKADREVVCMGLLGSGMYTWPNSSGAKVRVEQKPSEEDIIKVKPSLDLSKQLGR